MAARSQSDLGSKVPFALVYSLASCIPKSQTFCPRTFCPPTILQDCGKPATPKDRRLKEGNEKKQIFSASPFPKNKDCTFCMFCTRAHHVTAEQMLNGNNIPIAVQKDNQAETFKNKQDKTVLKSNKPSSQSLSKSHSNILMAFPLSHVCCCFPF